MPELNSGHIEIIALDVARQDIYYSHLKDELIDHICCEVENEMENGLDFGEAYRRVRKRMGRGRLREIQEETLYAVDTKYRNMKNTMKVSGIAGTIMLGFAALFKIQHWPLAGILLTLGAVTLAFVFLPSALMVLWKESHSRKRLFLYISALMTGAFFITGTLFKVQHWPAAGVILLLSAFSGIVLFTPSFLISKLREQEKGSPNAVYILAASGVMFYGTGIFFKIMHWPLSGLLLFAGMVILCLIALPWYTISKWKHEAHISPRFLFLLIGMLLIIVPGALINMNLQQSYEAGFYDHLQQQLAMTRYMANSNSILLSSHPDSTEYELMAGLNRRTTEMIELIGTIQARIVGLSEGVPGNTIPGTDKLKNTENGTGIIYGRLSSPFQPYADIASTGPGTLAQRELEEALAGYSVYIDGLLPGADRGRYGRLLDASVYFTVKPDQEGQLSLMSQMHSLELLKNSILVAESEILRSLAGRN